MSNQENLIKNNNAEISTSISALSTNEFRLKEINLGKYYSDDD